ncbi:hypothetical protein OWM07_02965 [Deferribacter thermophilus]
MSFCLAFVSCTNKKDDLIEIKCGKCHSTSIIYNYRGTKSWEHIVYAMQQRGLKLTRDEKDNILKALKKIK